MKFEMMGSAKGLKLEHLHEKIKYPVMIQPKLDGIRVGIHQVLGPVTRSLKPVPNKFIRERLSNSIYYGLDGEVICADEREPDCYRKTNKTVMTEDTGPETSFAFIYFDKFDEPNLDYQSRFERLYEYLTISGGVIAKRIDSVLVNNGDEALAEYQRLLQLGYEGAMIKGLRGPYKFGSSTIKEGYSIKLKPMVDAEATVIGYEPVYHNANEAKKNALGRTERSSNKENMIPLEKLGSLHVRLEGFEDFKIGTGFTDAERVQYWQERDTLVGRSVTFAYQEVGIKDSPRFPSFKGFRTDL